jgi:predicted amidohydrolase
MKLRVAGAQLAVTGDIESNAAAILRAVGFAADEKAQVLVTPEGSLSGYTPRFDREAVREALAKVTAAAKAARVALALGTCLVEPDDGKCYDELRFYAADGRCLGFHTKALLCGTLAEPPAGEINDYGVRPLRTFVLGGLTVGGLVCNDMWANPTCTPMPDAHLSQKLSEMGARVIFHAVNGGRDGSEGSDLAWQYHESNLRLRARAGRLWIVTVDSSHPTHLRCSAPSGVVAPDGRWVCRAEPKGEQYFAYTIALGD